METQVRDATRVLVAQRAELARVERLAAVGEVSAALAHEVRNPLAAIRAACRSLIEDTGEEDTRERLKMIDEEVGRLLGIVDRPLRGTGHRPEEPRPAELTHLIRNLVRLMKYQMPRSVSLRMSLPRQFVVHLPPNGLRQALLNLLKNSQEALEGRAGSVSIAVTQREDGIEIQVEDTGCGFPPELLASGIRRFVTGKEGGTGLGLAMAERYIRDQGGRLEIANRAEGGARVRIVLPRREPTEPSAV
jgi:C4-dicarboxylate-specific signal transduction histidine kinase